jgi:O-antigen/teichoic acid export membrane protein
MTAKTGLRSFARDSLLSILRQGLSMVFGLLTSIIIARSLGVDARGVFAIAFVLLSLLIALFNSGVTVSLIYYVASADYSLGQSIRQSVAVTLWVALVGVGTGALFILLVRSLLFANVALEILLLTLVALPVSMFKDNLNAIFRGRQDFQAYNLVEIIPQAGILLFTLLFTAAMKLGVIGALLAIISGRLLGAVAAIYLMRRQVPGEALFNWKPDAHYTRQMAQYARSIYAAVVSNLVLYRADTLLLNLLVGLRSVGIYDIAVSMVERVWALAEALSTVMLPRIAALKDDEAERRQITPLIARYLLYINLVMGIGLSLIAEWLIVVLYGEAFRESALALRLLAPGIIAWGVSALLAQDVAGRGKPGYAAASSAGVAILNVVLNLILIPRLDYAGAAITSTITYTTYAITLTVIFCRFSGTRWTQLILPERSDLTRLRTLGGWVRSRLTSKRHLPD